MEQRNSRFKRFTKPGNKEFTEKRLCHNGFYTKRHCNRRQHSLFSVPAGLSHLSS